MAIAKKQCDMHQDLWPCIGHAHLPIFCLLFILICMRLYRDIYPCLTTHCCWWHLLLPVTLISSQAFALISQTGLIQDTCTWICIQASSHAISFKHKILIHAVAFLKNINCKTACHIIYVSHYLLPTLTITWPLQRLLIGHPIILFKTIAFIGRSWVNRIHSGNMVVWWGTLTWVKLSNV